MVSERKALQVVIEGDCDRCPFSFDEVYFDVGKAYTCWLKPDGGPIDYTHPVTPTWCPLNDGGVVEVRRGA